MTNNSYRDERHAALSLLAEQAARDLEREKWAAKLAQPRRVRDNRSWRADDARRRRNRRLAVLAVIITVAAIVAVAI